MKTIKIKPSSPDQGEFVVINESDFDPKVHELAEGETSPNTIVVNLTAAIAPELQATIDKAKAECAKVVAENSELKEQLATTQDEFTAFKDDIVAMQARIDELQPAIKKPTAAEVKAAKTEQAKE